MRFANEAQELCNEKQKIVAAQEFLENSSLAMMVGEIH